MPGWGGGSLCTEIPVVFTFAQDLLEGGFILEGLVALFWIFLSDFVMYILKT